MQVTSSAIYEFPVGPLPSGRHSLTRETVLASQRGRLLDAMAVAVAEHGYGNTTIAHVVSHAGVSRKTFYDHFKDKNECFLAMYDTGIGFLLQRVSDTIEDQEDPHSRLVVGLQAVLSILSAEPAFCRAIIVEVHAAGPEALARRRAVVTVFADRYLDANRQARENGSKIAELSVDKALATVGGILDLISTRVEADRTETLPELADELTSFAVHNVLPRR